MASRPIDEKLVVMRLENEQFKAKAAETVGIFGKLKQALGNVGNTRLDKVSNELIGIQKYANGINMNFLSSAVDTISSRFSTLGIVATTALTNITNQAVNAGMALQHSLTTQQITDGFREYETKIGAIGTVLSNTEWAGTDLEDVKRVLEELNVYADNTVYSFGQMTENIGRFTAAGVTIDDSAIAIKGLSNLAAASGSNVHQLNTAMYQMSQSMAAGTMNLMDWNSLVNAGMAGKKTQDALLETAKAMGVNVDMSEGFRNSISKGWLTAEVFLETMKKFGKDESMTEAATAVRTFTGMLDSLKEGIGSGWATSWEIIFGDYEKATIFWTAISSALTGVFAKQTKARNDMLQNLANSGVLEKFGETVTNIATPVVQLFKAVGSAFSQIFPPRSSEGLIKVASGIADLTSRLKMSDQTVQNVTTIFKGMFSIFSTGFEIVKILGSALLGLVPSFESTGGGALGLVAKLFELPIALNNFIKSSDAVGAVASTLKSAFAGVGKVLGLIGTAFMNLGETVDKTFSIFAKADFGESSVTEESSIVRVLLGIRDAIDSVFGYIANINYSAIGAGIVGFFEGAANTIIWVKDKIVEAVTAIANLPSTIMDNQGWILAGGGIAGLAAIVWKAYETFRSFSKVGDLIGNSAEMVKSLGETFEAASGVFDAASSSLKAFTLGIHVKSLLTIAMAVGILAVSFKLLADLDATQIANGLYMVTLSLTAMVGALAVMSYYSITGSFQATLAIVAMSASIGILSVAVKSLADMDYEEMTRGIIGLVAILGTLTGAIVLMSKFGSSFAVGALQFIAIASAIHILISAVDKIGGLDSGSLTKSLVVLGIILGQLAVFINLASTKGAVFTASATGILATAGAIMIIVQAMKQLGSMDDTKLVKGLVSVGALLTMLGGFVFVAGKSNLMVTGAGLILLSVALNALVIPIATLGNMNLETLAKGVGAVVLALAALTALTNAMTSAIPGAIAVTILAVALNLLVIPIAALGAMTWSVILTGIGALTLALLALGGVAALLGVATLPLIGFGVAIAAIGAGFMMFGKGLLIITTTSVASVTIVLTAFASLVTGLVTLMPAITDLLMKIANAVIEVMVKMAPKIADAMGRLLVVIMDKVREYAPQVVELILQTLELVMQKLSEYIPKYLDIIAELLVTILDRVGTFINDAVRVILDFLLSLINTIGEYVPLFIQAGTDLILGFLHGLEENIPLIMETVAQFMVTMVTSMADTIETEGPLLIDAVMRLMAEVVTLIIEAGLSVIDALFGWIPGVSKVTEEIGKTAGEYIDKHFNAYDIANEKGVEFSDGLSGTSGLAKTAGENIARAGMDGAGSVDATSTGKNFTIGFANGISSSSVLSNVISSARNLASTAYNTITEALDINSPSRETHILGEETGNGFANGIESKTKSVMESMFPWLYAVKDTGEKASKQATTSGEKAGNNAMSGMGKGITKSAPKATSAAKKAGTDAASEASKAFKEKMDDLDYKFEMGEINHDKHVQGIEALKKSYSKYSELVKEANLEIKKIEEDAFKSRMDTLDHKFEMGEINYDEHIAGVKKLEKAYSKYAHLVMDANKKIKKLEDDRLKDILEKEDNVHNKRKALIEDRKFYNELSLKQELEAWERMQARHAEGTAKRNEADREVYRLKKEIHDKLISLNDEYLTKVQDTNAKLIEDEVALSEKYGDALLSRIQEIRSGLGGVFDEFTINSDISGQKLMDNLQSQLNGMMTWSREMQVLSSKGLDEGLIEELRKMGPKAAGEIAALNKMTYGQLQQYSANWKITNALVRTQAIGELQEMKTETDEQIAELRKGAKEQLEAYKTEWITKVKEIRTGVPEQFDGLDATMESIGEGSMRGLLDGLSKMEGPLVNEAKSIASSITKAIQGALKYAPVLSVVPEVSSTVKSMTNVKTNVNKAGEAIQKAIDGVLTTEQEKTINVNANVNYSTSGLPKIEALTVVPDLGQTQYLTNSIVPIPQIKQTQQSQQSQSSNSSAREDIAGLTAALTAYVDKPQINQLYVDGRLMTEVVSRNQYSDRMIAGMTRGV